MSADDEREDFLSKFFELAETYELPLTNNTPRVQDGQMLRHIGDFIADVERIFADAGYTRPRVITTVDELEALPVGSVVRDVCGIVLEVTRTELGNPGFVMTNERGIYSSAWVALNAIVLFTPTPEGEAP